MRTSTHAHALGPFGVRHALQEVVREQLHTQS